MGNLAFSEVLMNAVGCGQSEGKNLDRHNAKQERKRKQSKVKFRQNVELRRVRSFGNQFLQDFEYHMENGNGCFKIRSSLDHLAPSAQALLSHCFILVFLSFSRNGLSTLWCQACCRP